MKKHHFAAGCAVLALGLAAARNAPVPDTTFGVFRM